MIKHVVGNGQNTFIWYMIYDNWHPTDLLLEVYNRRVVYDSGLSLHAKVSSVISAGEWNRPHARSNDLLEIQIQV